MIFSRDGYLVIPYKPFFGASSKNDDVLTHAVQHPERFLVSPLSGDPQVLVAQLLTDPRNAAWEVWRSDTFTGILCLDRVTPRIDARLQFVFFDDELASKAPLLRDFLQRCFDDFGLSRITFEAPANMTMLTGFVRRKLGFAYEGAGSPMANIGSRRERAYFDGERWHDLIVLRKHATPEVQ